VVFSFFLETCEKGKRIYGVDAIGSGGVECWLICVCRVDNMFSIAGNRAHAARKRMISNIYSKSVVTASPALLAQTSIILYERFLPFLAAAAAEGEARGVLNVTSLVYATTLDIVTAYIFGIRSSSNLIDDPPQLAWFLDLYNSRRSYTFWPQEFPGFTAALEKWAGYRLVPKWVDEANGEIEKWTKKMCDAAAVAILQSDAQVHDVPTVYRQLSVAVAKEVKKNEDEGADQPSIVASEVLDHFAAGFDTSGITLTYVVHELSLHKDIQHQLQKELLTLSPRLAASSSPSLPDPKAVDALPFLHAVIWETLRLHSAIPGPQPRFTPSQGCRLGAEGQFFVPGGVRVSASAGLLHQNEDVYERAAEWLPERWLGMDKLDEEKRRDMESRWFWAFGRSVRVVESCVCAFD
jgi:cytochrome P450